MSQPSSKSSNSVVHTVATKLANHLILSCVKFIASINMKNNLYLIIVDCIRSKFKHKYNEE